MTKIIAEIGVNWSGDINIARDMIFRSKRAGADFVKFQMFNEEVIKDSPHKELLSKMILDYDKLKKLRDYAAIMQIEAGSQIGFGVSVMYPEAFDIIKELPNPVDFIKIRYKDHQNEKIAIPAVRYCNEKNIPLLVSTNRYIREEDYYRYNLYNTPHIKYLYCIPEYPPELKDISSNRIWIDYFEGYSNHYPSKFLPMIAVARKLEFVEIHIKREGRGAKSLYNPGLQPDENVSIDFDDLNEVCILRDIISEM